MRAKAVPSLVLLLQAILFSACQKSVDLTTGVQVSQVTTGWYDAGIVEDQKNKLVPSISFRIANRSESNLSGFQVNTVFRRVGETEEWGSAFARPFGRDGVAPGAVSNEIVLRSPRGYTGLQPRTEMLQNREFVDAKVEVFGKYGADNWTKLGEYQVQRQLLTQ
jgi:hypothetical protein